VRTGKQKQRAGDLNGAQVAFARAIKLERKNPAPYYLLLAQAQAAGKQYADALDTVNKLLSIEPGSQSGQLLKREISGMLTESRRR
jgi:tetratricopeptide (TPR) repeat protein